MLGSCWRRKTHVHMDCSTSQGSHHLCHSKMQSLSDLPLSLPINHSSPLPLSLLPLLLIAFLLFLSSYQSPPSSLSPSSSFSLPINHPPPPYSLPPLSLFLSIIPLPFASLSLYPSFSSLSPSSSFSLPINRPSLLLFLSLLPSFLPPPPPLSLSTQSPEGVSPR